MATDNITASSLIKNVSRYEDVKDQAKRTNEEMGKQDFLTLFTAQLQNQNPLEPVKNEAFVAQLAQFSQLEALTNMQTSLDSFVTSMSGERMLGSAALIGKKVAVTDTPTQLIQGGVIEGSIDLPMGASGIQVNVHDSQGRLVQELVAGPQTPGQYASAVGRLGRRRQPCPHRSLPTERLRRGQRPKREGARQHLVHCARHHLQPGRWQRQCGSRWRQKHAADRCQTRRPLNPCLKHPHPNTLIR